MILESFQDECALRIAANRAYYAMYHTVRRGYNRKYPKEALDNSYADHRRLRGLLLQKRQFPLSQSLGVLYELRELADYRLDEDMDSEQVKRLILSQQRAYEIAKTL